MFCHLKWNQASRYMIDSKLLLSNLYWVDVAIKMQCFDSGRTYLLKMTEENFFLQIISELQY